MIAIAIDDEPPALKVLEHFCQKTDWVQLQKTFTKPRDAQLYLQENPVDLLFLDIQMPSISGIDFYRSMEHEPMVIFTTAYSEFAVEGFNLKAIDYLLKPYTATRFLQAIEKARDYQELQQLQAQKTDASILIRADYSTVKIQIKDIVYIEGLDDYLKIHLENKQRIVARMTMKTLFDKLPAADFIRVHRSFIIPKHRIDNVRRKVITLAGVEIPIGRTYERAFFEAWKP
jgi:DNA-binding LytR/AlgR family response regulator